MLSGRTDNPSRPRELILLLNGVRSYLLALGNAGSCTSVEYDGALKKAVDLKPDIHDKTAPRGRSCHVSRADRI